VPTEAQTAECEGAAAMPAAKPEPEPEPEPEPAEPPLEWVEWLVAALVADLCSFCGRGGNAVATTLISKAEFLGWCRLRTARAFSSGHPAAAAAGRSWVQAWVGELLVPLQPPPPPLERLAPPLPSRLGGASELLTPCAVYALAHGALPACATCGGDAGVRCYGCG
jgi:hypothetical protein